MKKRPWLSTVFAAIILLLLGQAIGAADGGFSRRSFHGSYALGISGAVISVGPIAGTGVLVADGEGNLTGTQTISYGSGPCTFNVAGTYDVNPDGNGSGQLTVSGASGGTICTSGNGLTVTFSLVLVGGGKGVAKTVKLSETSPNYAVLGVGDRQ
jgi:hypothetical protein